MSCWAMKILIGCPVWSKNMLFYELICFLRKISKRGWTCWGSRVLMVALVTLMNSIGKWRLKLIDKKNRYIIKLIIRCLALLGFRRSFLLIASKNFWHILKIRKPFKRLRLISLSLRYSCIKINEINKDNNHIRQAYQDKRPSKYLKFNKKWSEKPIKKL